MVNIMKENLATFPLIDAFNANDECPFCNLERKAEQHAISFILGSAYMEDDIREKTDKMGLPHALQKNVRLRQPSWQCAHPKYAFT